MNSGTYHHHQPILLHATLIDFELDKNTQQAVAYSFSDYRVYPVIANPPGQHGDYG